MRYFLKYCCMVCLTILWGCNDVLEEDISALSVKIYAPNDGVSTEVYTVNYWWQEIPGATNYRIQIIKSDSLYRDSISLVTDSVVGKTQFEKTMQPGNYLWSILAFNGAYTSRRSEVYRLKVDSASLSSQVVNITAPGRTKDFTNKNYYTFSWEKLFGATKYLVKYQFGSTSKDTSLTTNTFDLPLSEESSNGYKVNIVAMNNTQQTGPSETYTIIYDKTPPDSVNILGPGSLNASSPALVSPAKESLNWQASVRPDISGIKSYGIKLLKSDGTSIPISGNLYNGTATSFRLSSVDSLLVKGTYKWNISVKDNAGNEYTPTTYYYIEVR